MHKKIRSIFLLTLVIISMVGCDNKVAPGPLPLATLLSHPTIEIINFGNNFYGWM